MASASIAVDGRGSARSGSVIGATIAEPARAEAYPSVSLGQEQRGARRQVDQGGLGQPALGEPGEELLARRERGPLVELVELDAGDELAVARPDIVPVRPQ